MTVDKAFKLAVRERMARTGEKYTEARRALASNDDGSGSPAPDDPVAVALRPGRVVGFVCGGGMTNLAMVMPYLTALEDQGHPLTYVIGGRDGLLEVPSPFDFACHRGIVTTTDAGALLREDTDELFRRLAAGMPSHSSTHGPMTDESWVKHLKERGPDGQPPVLWVQDVQSGPPLVRADAGVFDGVQWQLPGIRDLARRTGAIVAIGHCMPADYVEGWEVIVDGVDDTFVIFGDEWPDSDEPRGATIEHHSAETPPYEFRQDVDSRFSGWRLEYLGTGS